VRRTIELDAALTADERLKDVPGTLTELGKLSLIQQATERPAAMTETQQPYPGSEGLSMGLGWQLSNEYLDKNGGLDGYKTYMAFDPSRKIGLFLFGNTSGGTDALTEHGRLLLGALRDYPAYPSVFPHPSSIPQCP